MTPPDEIIGLITIQDFEDMDLPDSCRWELIDGEVISVTFPDRDHVDIQARLRGILNALFEDAAIVRTELPFAVDRHNKNGADIGVVDPIRYLSNRKRLEGAPEIVIEVVSRSNREKKMTHLQERCFGHGCRQFWRVYPKRRTVAAVRYESGDGATEYKLDDAIPLDLFGVAGRVLVRDIFES